MSQDTDAAYRVRTVETGIDPRNEGKVFVVVSRPYSTIGAARGAATRIKTRSAGSPYWDSAISIERATGWETV